MTTDSAEESESVDVKFQRYKESIQASFENIKKNPLNLNLLMTHVALLSETMHHLIEDIYPSTKQTRNATDDQ